MDESMNERQSGSINESNSISTPSSPSNSLQDGHLCGDSKNCNNYDCFVANWSEGRLIAVFTSLLESKANTYSQSSEGVPFENPFNAFFCPGVTKAPISELVGNIVRSSSISKSLFITAYAYMTMAEEKHVELRVSNRNVRRLLATAVALAAKGYDENFQRAEEFYTNICGIPQHNLTDLFKCENLLFNIIEQNVFLLPGKYAAFEIMWYRESKRVYSLPSCPQKGGDQTFSTSSEKILGKRARELDTSPSDEELPSKRVKLRPTRLNFSD